MWGKASWGTSAARWGAAAAVAGVVAVSPAPDGARAAAAFGARMAAAVTPGPATVSALSLAASRSAAFAAGSANILAAAAAPGGVATSRGSQAVAARGLETSIGLGATTGLRFEAVNVVAAQAARAATAALQLAAVQAAGASNHLTGTPASSVERASAVAAAAGRAAVGGARIDVARATRTASAGTGALAVATESARGGEAAAARAGLRVAQLEAAEADVVVGDFIGPQGVTVENAKAAALAISRGAGLAAQAASAAIAAARIGVGGTAGHRAAAARGTHETTARAAAGAVTQVASTAASTVFAERGGLPVFNVEPAAAAAARAGRVAVLGGSTHAARGIGLFGSTPNQFVDSIEAADASDLHAFLADMRAVASAAAQAGHASAGMAQTAASDVLNVVFVADAWPAGAEFFRRDHRCCPCGGLRLRRRRPVRHQHCLGSGAGSLRPPSSGAGSQRRDCLHHGIDVLDLAASPGILRHREAQSLPHPHWQDELMPGRSGGDRIKTTSASSSTGAITLDAAPADGLHQAFPAALDGKQVSYLIEHSTNQAQWEVGRGVYTHTTPTRTLTRPIAQVRLSSAGAGQNVNFSAGGLLVSVVGIWDDVDDLLHPTELTVAGALTVTGDHLGQLLNYTGAGHTWTLNAALDSGYITVFNNGTGPITIVAGTATVTGETTISVGSVGGILYSAAGTKAYVGNSSGPTYQEVNDPNVLQTTYQIARTSSDILVELTTDLTAPRTFLLPTTPAEGDLVRVYRNAGGFFDWTNSTTGTALGYRNDYAAFQRSGPAWKRIETRGRAGVRRENVSRSLTPADNGATIAVTGTATYTLPLNVGQSTGWRVTLEQRGVGYVTLVIDPASTPPPAPLVQVGSAILQTTYDGDALIIEALGSAEVKVAHRPVETAALAISGTSLFTSSTAGRPRRTTETGAVTFQLDNTAPVGASGLLIKGPGDITVQRAPNVEYGQEGANFSLSLETDNFQCQGIMGWEVVSFDGTIRKYLITGQTDLALSDPLNLASGDVVGVLSLNQGGTGVAAADNAALLAGIGGLPTAGGTMTGAIAMGGQNLTNVGRIDATTSVSRAVLISNASYTLLATDNGSILTFGFVGTTTVTVPAANTLAPNLNQGFAVLLIATGGAVTIDNVAGATNVTVRNGYFGTVVARNGGAIRAAEGAQAVDISTP